MARFFAFGHSDCRGNLAHGVADFQSYHDSSLLAKQFSKTASLKGFRSNELAGSFKNMDVYHQRFSFSSKVLVDRKPEELYLFGYKTRNRVTSQRIKKSITAFTEVSFAL